MIVEIIRLENSFNHGMFGVLRLDKCVFCVTLEPPYIMNRQNVSAILPLQYNCKRIVSPKFGETFEVQDVPGRSNILFHPGNRKINTEGCILLAQYYGKLSGNRAVLNSGNTFRRFMNRMKGINEFQLSYEVVF